MRMTELSMAFVGRVETSNMYIIGKLAAPGVDGPKVLAEVQPGGTRLPLRDGCGKESAG